MVFSRKELKNKAKESLTGKWKTFVLIMLLYMVILMVISLIPIAGCFIIFFVAPVLIMGIAVTALKTARRENIDITDLFCWYKINMWKAIGLYLVTGIYIFLWSLLLIVPGIIASLRYSMVFFIMADNPNITIRAALDESKNMTKGYKWEIFKLYFSFIGWGLLTYLTLGIGMLWLAPYMYTTLAEVYLKLRGQSEVTSEVTPEVSLEESIDAPEEVTSEIAPEVSLEESIDAPEEVTSEVAPEVSLEESIDASEEVTSKVAPEVVFEESTEVPEEVSTEVTQEDTSGEITEMILEETKE